MEWVVTTGKSVDEAKDAALDELGVDEVDAEFEVLEEPRQGLFGRVRGEARVRARVRPTAPRPKVERRDRRRRSDSGPARSESNTRSPNKTKAHVPTPDGSGPASGGGVAVLAAAGDAEELADGTARKGRRGGRGQGAGDTNGRGASAGLMEDEERPLPAKVNGGASVPEEELTLIEQGQVAEQFLVGLLERFGATADIAVSQVDDEAVEVQVNGAELGLLIGPKGQTLQAVQELTRTVVQRRSVARTGRIYVDIAGYRVRRREALERFTTQVADDVRATGVQRVLEPMSAADRKVVHDTANDLEGVRTISEGEEPRRRVVILPDGPGEDHPQPVLEAAEAAASGDVD